MAKKSQKTAKIAKILAIGALALAPAAATYANTVQVSVNVAPVASVEVVTEDNNGELIYTANITTNSTKGFDLYVSGNGEDWSLLKSIDHYPSDEEKVVTSTSNKTDLQFKVEPRK